MKVMQGEAVEGCYEVAADGYADLQYETTARRGEILAGHDAGVHTIRNPSPRGDLLVTVHLELDDPLRIDRVVGLGRADDPFQPRVVEFTG